MVSRKKVEALIERAKEARKHAYAPYSKVRIGAAILTRGGRIFDGCNVENASYGLSCCAERAAIFKAVSEGYLDIVAIAVVGESEDFTKPCGACRQVMVEFNPEMKVLRRGTDGFSSDTTATALLPSPFKLQRFSKK
jgi:cytidine deaminase